MKKSVWSLVLVCWTLCVSVMGSEMSVSLGANGVLRAEGLVPGSICTVEWAPSLKDDFTANGYRLPTIDEWGYAARGGVEGTRYPWGDTIVHSIANYQGRLWYNGHETYNYDNSNSNHPLYSTGDFPWTSPVGSFPANGYGLYDMSGNISEWCYSKGPEGSVYFRALKGGNWNSLAPYVTCASESDPYPDSASFSYGFRSVRLTGSLAP